MTKRIAIMTGGGDCPGLNAAIRAVVMHAHDTYGWSVVGIEDAYAGLYEKRFVELPVSRVRDLLARGGTILGSSNRAHPFAYPIKLPDGTEAVHDVSEQCVENLRHLDVEGLVVVGGDGTMAMSHRLMQKGINVVGIPKTIDNDLEATEYTIGYQTALEVVVDALDRLHTTAESHDRIIICEVMGRYAGWIGLNAGIAGGADVILIPEIDYDVDRVVKSLHKRHGRGNTYSIIVVAEGAKPVGGGYAEERAADVTQQAKLGGAGQALAEAIAKRCDYDVRVTVLGHLQRGGTPCAFDRLLATRFGVRAVELIANGEFGRVAAIRAGKIVTAPMDQAVAKLKLVDPSGGMVATARGIGIELGG